MKLTIRAANMITIRISNNKEANYNKCQWYTSVGQDVFVPEVGAVALLEEEMLPHQLGLGCFDSCLLAHDRRVLDAAADAVGGGVHLTCAD